MNQIAILFKRELLGYFRSPLGYVFLCIFLMVSVILAFTLTGFFKGQVASLESFFALMPWLFIILIPAAGMRLWAEEKRAGTWELLLTLPLSTLDAVLAKFLAAWAFVTLAILLTFPMIITVAYLGDPDGGVIISSYLGTILMAGSYLGIASLTSALTRSQVISFVISVVILLALVLLGYSIGNFVLSSFLPVGVVDALSNFSFTTHYQSMLRGLITFEDLFFFISIMVVSLLFNVLALER